MREQARDRRAAAIGGFVVLSLLLYVGAYFAVAEPVLFGPYDHGAPCTGPPIDTQWGNAFFEPIQIELDRRFPGT